ncbi:ESPR-type extended signal peptide-containing protein [Snodgrassella alvi]|uniref:ESPR-type extended signal peptide-containing protein n=1 Tax=Snodgrassella alvi TaxID=1196083 RepID=UPI00352D0239
MNKIYRAIWNESTQTWVAASELAKSKTKANTVSCGNNESPVLGKICSNAFKAGLLTSLVNFALLAPNSYAGSGTHSLMGGATINSAYDGYQNVNTTAIEGDDFDYCGADNVSGRGSTQGNSAAASKSISALEEYLRFAKNTAFSDNKTSYNPYGTTERVESWTQASGTGQVTQGKDQDGKLTPGSGYQNRLTGGYTITYIKAFGIGSFAYGCNAYTTGNQSLAFNANATATAGGAQAFGVAAYASGRASNAIGVSSQAAGVSGVALGSVANSAGVGSVAFGLQSNAVADGTVAVGVNAQASVDSAVAIGNDSFADGKESISIGSGNKVSGEGSIAIGNSETASTYAAVDGTQSGKSGGNTIITGNRTLSIGNKNTGTTDTGGISAANTSLFGNKNKIYEALDGVHVIGNSNQIGVANATKPLPGNGATVIGNNTIVTADNAIALGNSTYVSGESAIAIGNSAKATEAGAVALGKDSFANTAGNVAGYNPNENASADSAWQSKVTGANTWKSTTGAVAVGNTSNTSDDKNITRQITGVAAGSDYTDAVNVAQLKSLHSYALSSLNTESETFNNNLVSVGNSIDTLSTSVDSKLTDLNSKINSLSVTALGENGQLNRLDKNIADLSLSTSDGIKLLQQNTLQYKKDDNLGGFYNVGSDDGRTQNKIINVEADDSVVTDGSTYLINGGLLNKTNSQISLLSSSISDGVTKLNSGADEVSSTTSDKAPKIDAQMTVFNQSLSKDISNLRSVILEWTEEPDKSKTFKSKDETKITGVARGDADSASSSDAVTGGQLSEVNSLVTKVTNDVKDSTTNNNIQVDKLALDTDLAISDTNTKLDTLTTSISTGLSRITRNALLFNETAGKYQEDTNKTPQKISNAEAGDISENSDDAITGGQLYTTNTKLINLSSSISAGWNTLSEQRSSISTSASSSLSTLSGIINGKLESLSTVTTNSLQTLSNNLQVLSSSASTAISNLQESTILYGADGMYHATRDNLAQKITGVAPADLSQKNSMDMVNGGQLYTTNSRIDNLSTDVNTNFSSLSGSISVSVSSSLSDLSASLNVNRDKVSSLQANALQWDDIAKAYSAKHGNTDSTTDGRQKITNVLEGNITSPDSTDAVTGGQYYNLDTAITDKVSTLSTNALSSVDGINKSISLLQQQMLTLDGNKFNAERAEIKQKITGVAEAALNSASTDAVVGKQLSSTNFSLSSLITSTNAGFKAFSNSLDQYSENTEKTRTDLVNGINTSISSLQSNALLWDKDNGYSATHDIKGNQKITNVSALDGNLAPGSTDALTGSQVSRFITSRDKSINKVYADLQGLSADSIKKLESEITNGLNGVNQEIAGLKQNLLLWNDKAGAYDASHNTSAGAEKITNVAEGRLVSGSTDAVTGKQLFTTKSNIATLSTSLVNDLDKKSNSINDNLNNQKTILGNSIATGINKLGSDINSNIQSVDSGIEDLKQTALQWNGSSYDASHGQVGGKNKITNVDQGNLYDKSTDAVIGDQLARTNTSIKTLSDGLGTSLQKLSGSISSIVDQYSSDWEKDLITRKDSFSASISSGLSNINTSLSKVKQNALLWNGSAYDASVENSKGTITNVAKGDLQKDSHDAIVGAQLFTTNTKLNSLSTSFDDKVKGYQSTTQNSLNSLSTALGNSSFSDLESLSSSAALALGNINDGISDLKQNALQWKGNAYNAGYGAESEKKNITNVADGLLAKGSKDAVTGNQLYNTNVAISDLKKEVDDGVTRLTSSHDIFDKNIAALTEKLGKTAGSLSSLSTTTETDLNSINTGISNLQDNALQWKDSAYNARHGTKDDKNIITHVAAGSLKEDSSDAVTGAQLFGTQSNITVLESKLTGVSDSLSSGISSLSDSLNNLTTSNLSALEQSRDHIESDITSLSSITSSVLSSADSDLAVLSENALQWKDGSYDASHGKENDKNFIKNAGKGDVYAGSTDAITGDQLYTTGSHLDALSYSFSTSFDSFSTTLNSLIDKGVGSLSSSVANIDGEVSKLQQNALQWNKSISAYDASSVTGKPAKITQVADGRVELNSSDAITGAQLFSLSTVSKDNLVNVASSMNLSLSTIQDSVDSSSASLSSQYDTLSKDISNNFNEFSTSTSISLDSLSTGNSTTVSNLADGINTSLSAQSDSIDNSINKLSTEFDNNLNNLTSNIAESAEELTNSLNTVNKGVNTLKQNALQWNEEAGAYSANHGTGNAQRITNVAAGNVAPDSSDAINGSQFFQLSGSASTGLNNLSTSLSTVTNNQLNSLSTIISNSLSTVNQNVSSLSTGLNTVTEKVTALQTDALQWDKVNGNYKADHGTGNAQKITQVAAGSIAANSTDAVNGAQMYSLSTGTADSVNKLTENLNKTNLGLGSLSTATNTDLKNLKDSLNSTSDKLTQLTSSTSGSIQSISTSLDTLTTSTANSLQSLDKGLKDTSSSVSALQTNALQWNADKGVYDASRNGSAKVLSGVAAGAVSAVSTEAVNGGQLYSLSTVTVAGLNSVSTGLSSLSESATTGLNNLSASLSSANQNLITLQQNALQWNSTLTAYDAGHNGTAQRITNVAAGNIALDSTDAVNGGQLFSLSSSASTGLSSLSTNLSKVTDNQLGSLSTIIGDNLNTVNQNVSSLSSSLNDTNTNVGNLQKDALQWNSTISAYDATRGGRAQKLTGIAGGDISDTSSDAVNGAQMYSLSTLTQTGLSSSSTGLSSLSSVTSSALNNVNRSLESLSTETHTGLSSVSTGLSSLSQSTTTGLNNLTASLSSTNQNLTTLQQNALQWNGTAYDAGRSNTVQKITNVAAGRIAVDSTDAVNGSQFFNLSGSTSTGLNSLSTSLSTVTNDQLSSLSTITGDNLNTVNKNVTSLSTSLDKTNINVGNLQKDALQRNRVSGDFDARREDKEQKLTGIAAGDISATSSDVINGTQMFRLSTLTQTGLGSISTGLSSLSSVTSSSLDNVNRSLESLSTETQTGLNSISTGLSSLSESTTTGLNNLTASLNSTNQNLTTLQQNALQWNSTLNAYDAVRNGTAQRITNVAAGRIAADSTEAVNGSQFFNLSSSTSTGLSSLSTVVSSTVINGISTISSSLSTGYESLSHSLSTATDNLQQLTNITSSSLSSLSTVASTTQNDVTDLKEKVLKWNDDKGGFDAGRPNNLTRDPGLGKIYNVKDGEIAAGSHEAVTGGQLYTVQTDLSALSTSTSDIVNSLNKTLDELSTSNVITNVANLTKNALQWKDDGTGNNTGFYDAGYNGTAQRITNIAAGNIAQGSLDAVNAGQLWTVQSSLSTLSTKVDALPTGNVSDAELASLSTAISTGIANQISTAASSLGTSYQPSANSIEPPKYDSITPTGGVVSADNVDDALANLRNYGTKFVKSNSAKATSVAQGADSIAVGGAAMASGTSAVAIGDSASAPSANAVALGSQAKVTQTGGVALGAGSVANTAAGIESYIPVTATSQQAAAIRATKSTEGAVSVGDASKGVYRQITGVAAGTADTDAVNVAQLKGVDNQVSRINEYVNQINDNVHRVERRAYSGTAMAMALSGAYLPSLNGGEQTVGVGVGAYRGYGAIGVNYKAASKNGKITWGAGVSTTGKEVAVNSVLGFKW